MSGRAVMRSFSYMQPRNWRKIAISPTTRVLSEIGWLQQLRKNDSATGMQEAIFES
jgi:hypothetical protein